ncbi:hypothetical protein M433DRAFT_4579 [Acidomyces richmondensis BFW]|nr:MAG: hypothetical protein FE78DRAFT_31826 [Acidomyces sp. 'richmondensis']KYG45437.1 hypothetical protein M433DRAFT_4579 [Acidomyces richmondensis BFW]
MARQEQSADTWHELSSETPRSNDYCNESEECGESFTESAILAEQRQIFYQKLGESQRIEENGFDQVQLEHKSFDVGPYTHTTSTEDLAQVVKVHRHRKSSSAPPLQRLLTVAPTEEPLPLYGKLKMNEMGYKYGSLEQAGMRTRAARSITRQVEKSSHSDSLDVHRKAESLPADLNVRCEVLLNGRCRKIRKSRKRVRDASHVLPGTKSEERKQKTD